MSVRSDCDEKRALHYTWDEESSEIITLVSSSESSSEHSYLGVASTSESGTGTDSLGWPSSTSIESSSKSSSKFDSEKNPVTGFQQEQIKAEPDGPVTCFTPRALSDELTSVQEKNVQHDGSMVLNRSEPAYKSRSGSWKKIFNNFVVDPSKHKEGDSGLSSCLSIKPEKLAEQKKVNQQLGLILEHDAVLLKSLKNKDQVCRANSYEAQEVEIKSLQTPVCSKITTENELKESLQGLILESRDCQKNTKSH